jgi:hypothetical protein
VFADFSSVFEVTAGACIIFKVDSVSYLWVPLRLYIIDLFVLHFPKILMGKAIDFYGKPSRMSNKMIIIIPKEFHKDFEKMLGKLMKFHGEEVMD